MDAVFSGPLGPGGDHVRAGMPVIVVDDLAEVHHGEMAGLTSAEIRS